MFCALYRSTCLLCHAVLPATCSMLRYWSCYMLCAPHCNKRALAAVAQSISSWLSFNSLWETRVRRWNLLFGLAVFPAKNACSLHELILCSPITSPKASGRMCALELCKVFTASGHHQSTVCASKLFLQHLQPVSLSLWFTGAEGTVFPKSIETPNVRADPFKELR